MKYSKVTPKVTEELQSIVGSDNVMTEPHEILMRTMSAAPFPFHKWKEYMPDLVVLPRSTNHVVQIVKLANRYVIPIVPRAGGTGLADGALPLRGGIVVDISGMNKILEIDEENMCVTVQPGVNMETLNVELGTKGLWFPDDPASYPSALIGGRIGTSGWSLIGGRYGHTRDLVLSLEVVLPTGKVIRVGEGGSKKSRKSSTGYTLKYLFMGHQGTLGITTEATLEIIVKPEVEYSADFGYKSFEDAYETLRKLQHSGVSCSCGYGAMDEEKIEWERRWSPFYILLPSNIRSVVFWTLYGTEGEVEAARKILTRICEEGGGTYFGRQLSEESWAGRHDGYAIPFNSRTKDGKVIQLKWHCEDASIPFSEIPKVRKKWHKIANKYREYGFDNWGIFVLNNNPFKPQGDYLLEIDIGVPEVYFEEDTWRAWVNCKREISEVTLEVGGSISACHGCTREGDVQLLPKELSKGGFDLMKQIKKMLDPNNIMNPGKYLLDEAYKQEV